ncbi:MAG: DUF3467 domain-containing protein [Chloroflexota bacterium]
MAKKAEEPTTGKQIRIVWGSDEELPALYANHIYVSHAGETEFHLVFGHLSPPLMMASDENELPDTVKIKPVSKIVITPDVMRAFVRLLADNLEKYEEKTKGKSDD